MSTFLVLHLTDRRNPVRPKAILAIMTYVFFGALNQLLCQFQLTNGSTNIHFFVSSIAAFHILASFRDQFHENVIMAEGHMHQVGFLSFQPSLKALLI
jgi:hypothetical protein